MTDDEQTQKRRAEDFSINFENQILVMNRQIAAELSRKLFDEIDGAIMGMPIVASDHLPDDGIYTIKRPGFDVTAPFPEMPVDRYQGNMLRWTSGVMAEQTAAITDMSWAVNYATVSFGDWAAAISAFPFRLRPWVAYVILGVLLMILILLLSI